MDTKLAIRVTIKRRRDKRGGNFYIILEQRDNGKWYVEKAAPIAGWRYSVRKGYKAYTAWHRWKNFQVFDYYTSEIKLVRVKVDFEPRTIWEDLFLKTPDKVRKYDNFLSRTFEV